MIKFNGILKILKPIKKMNKGILNSEQGGQVIASSGSFFELQLKPTFSNSFLFFDIVHPQGLNLNHIVNFSCAMWCNSKNKKMYIPF